ncbi:GntR family transcriptional regulator [Neptunomonas japonica]|uniref:GntR family transcriptional regulator, carbon starvation induced regulator n=1 Tax=Neptunomonas japonica JAMM 1380 TaxID=1441457 RepID=A0A7R6PHG6_9GAMM|nr:GntR family transcriptional regulator [Neptunomonas japonica]BBB29693.1 GntR family transcriptional regulator, carbon starvation induced regulator [Neptunomonas japonica JAMM 1380]
MLKKTKLDRGLPRAQQIYNILKNAIILNELMPGEPISKEQLSELFGVSRTPISDALAKLAESGLVDIYPQHGTFVSKISRERVYEGAFVRNALEVAIVKSVAENITPEQLERLQSNLRIQRLIVSSADFESFYKYDNEFHELLCSFTGYKRVGLVIENAKTQLDRTRRLMAPIAGSTERALKEHELIFDALRKGDSLAAQKAMTQHLNMSMKTVETVYNENRGIFTEDE